MTKIVQFTDALSMATTRAWWVGCLAAVLAAMIPASVSGSQSVTLAWNPVTNANVAGYNVYYGSASRNYTNVISAGNATTATISSLMEGATYYFATTTLNTAGLESAYSGEVSYTVPNVVPPPPSVITKTITASIPNPITFQLATNLAAPNWQTIGTFAGPTTLSFTNLPAVFIRGICSNLTGSVTLTWAPSLNLNVVGYTIYYGVASHTYSSVVQLGKVTRATIPNLTAGRVYYFIIDTYGPSGNLSPYLGEMTATPQASGFSLTVTGN